MGLEGFFIAEPAHQDLVNRPLPRNLLGEGKKFHTGPTTPPKTRVISAHLQWQTNWLLDSFRHKATLL